MRKQGWIHCRKYKCKLWEIQLENGLTNMKPSLAANTTLNWKKSCWKRCSKKVDKLEAQRNVLQLRPEMTCASWDSVQGLYTWCRSQWCVSCGGVQSIFSVLEASEVKLPALRAFVLPTHFPSGSGNLTTKIVMNSDSQLSQVYRIVLCRKVGW